MTFLGEILSVSAALFWAIGVVLFKKSGESITPMALNLFKNLFAVALLVPTTPLLAALLGEPVFPDQSPKDWILLAASGVLGIAVADTMFFIALNRLGAGLIAVVDTSYAPIMLFLSWLVLGEQIGFEVLTGAALIMTAMLLGSAAPPTAGITRRDIVFGTIIGIGGIILMGIGIVMIKGVLVRVPLIWANGVRLLFGCIGLVVMILFSPRRRKIFGELRPSPSWKYAVPASFFGTYLAMITWLGGMKYVDVSVASLLNQLSTIFIFVLSVVFLKEQLTRRRFAAFVLAFVGAIIVMWR